METGNVLADHVKIRRPPAFEQRLVRAVADSGDVVDERIHPDVDHARRVVGHRDAPQLPGAAHRDVFESRFDQSQNLVATNVRYGEVCVLRKVSTEGFLVFRQTEEIVLLAQPLRLGPVNRTQAVDEVLLLLERFAGDAVPPFVVSFVDVAGLRHPPHELLYPGLVSGFGCPDEVVERDIEAAPDLDEFDGHAIAVRLRIFTELAGTAKHVL